MLLDLNGSFPFLQLDNQILILLNLSAAFDLVRLCMLPVAEDTISLYLSAM